MLSFADIYLKNGWPLVLEVASPGRKLVGVDALFPGRFCHVIGDKRFEYDLEFQGCWMALELLSHEIYLHVASVYLTLPLVSSLGSGTVSSPRRCRNSVRAIIVFSYHTLSFSQPTVLDARDSSQLLPRY